MSDAEKQKSITQFIADHIVGEHTSWELQEIIDRLPEGDEEAASEFCDAFDLGDWFYEAMIINDIDINEVLIDLAEQRRIEEEEAARDRAEIDRDYRQMQGYPY